MTSPFYFLQKYQPHQFSDMIGNQEVVEQIARMGESRQIPHLILNGPLLMKQIYTLVK